MSKKYTKLSEDIIRIIFGQIKFPEDVLLRVTHSELVSIIEAQIECSLSADAPRLTTFHKTITEYVNSIDSKTVDSTHTIEEIKSMVTQLNKQYLNPVIPEENGLEPTKI